jgi:hypothetical protein
MNHWSVSMGSITAWVRSPRGIWSLWGLAETSRPLGLQFVQDLLACHVAVQALVFGRGQVVHPGVQGQDVDGGQVVALAHLPVVEIVGWGDLHHAGAEFPVHVVVGDDGDGPLGHRQAHALADQVGVALIGRVHRHGGVTQQGFRAGGGHRQETLVWPWPSSRG